MSGRGLRDAHLAEGCGIGVASPDRGSACGGVTQVAAGRGCVWRCRIQRERTIGGREFASMGGDDDECRVVRADDPRAGARPRFQSIRLQWAGGMQRGKGGYSVDAVVGCGEIAWLVARAAGEDEEGKEGGGEDAWVEIAGLLVEREEREVVGEEREVWRSGAASWVQACVGRKRAQRLWSVARGWQGGGDGSACGQLAAGSFPSKALDESVLAGQSEEQAASPILAVGQVTAGNWTVQLAFYYTYLMYKWICAPLPPKFTGTGLTSAPNAQVYII